MLTDSISPAGQGDGGCELPANRWHIDECRAMPAVDEIAVPLRSPQDLASMHLIRVTRLILIGCQTGALTTAVAAGAGYVGSVSSGRPMTAAEQADAARLKQLLPQTSSVQGFSSLIPHPSKSLVLRVARDRSRDRAIAAICASNCAIGRPERRRPATRFA